MNAHWTKLKILTRSIAGRTGFYLNCNLLKFDKDRLQLLSFYFMVCEAKNAIAKQKQNKSYFHKYLISGRPRAKAGNVK